MIQACRVLINLTPKDIVINSTFSHKIITKAAGAPADAHLQIAPVNLISAAKNQALKIQWGEKL
jgi:ribose 1,5-bisphosphokinase PhnN